MRGSGVIFKMQTAIDNKIKANSSVTMSDVARVAGVSKMTVSFALNNTGRVSEKTRQIVMETARQLGYEPNPHAQNLSNGRCNNTVGLFSLWFDFGVGSQKIQLIQSALNQKGFDVPIYGVGLHDHHNEDVQADAIASLRRQRPRGLICFTNGLHAKALLELRRYQDEGGILVSYDYRTNLDCDAVLFDRVDNTYQAAKHLIDLGHRKLGYADHGFARFNGPRVIGFHRAIAEVEGEWRPEWLIEAGSARDYAKGGHILAEKYLALRDRPTAMCIVNDYSAMVFINELERAGVSCPADVSVVGHDNHAMSQFARVPLSTMTHPSETIAQHAAEFLISRLNREYDGPARTFNAHGDLIARKSSAALQENATHGHESTEDLQ